MALNDEILRATGGPTINDGLRSWFGALPGGNLNDAERLWLLNAIIAVNFAAGAPDIAVGWTNNGNGTYTSQPGVGNTLEWVGVLPEIGEPYSCNIVVTGMVAAGIVDLSLSGAVGTIRSANGDYTQILVPTGTDIIVNKDVLFDGTVAIDVSFQSFAAFDSGTINDLWMQYLGLLGYSGALNDRLLAYWAAQP